MPSSLYNMLNFRPAAQSPVLPVEGDEDYAGMISDGDVSDMQDNSLDEQTAFNSKLPVNPITNELRGVLSLKSGFDTKQQGLSALRRTLGADRTKVRDAKDLANNNAANTMALEKQRESSAEKIASTQAQLQNDRIRAQQEFAAGQAALGRTAIDNRTAATQAQTNAHAHAVQAGQRSRLQSQQAEARAKVLEAQAAKMGRLSNLFGAKDKLLQQAAQIRSQALRAGGQQDAELQQAAQNFRSAYPDAGPDQIMSLLQQGGVSPEDMQALYDELTQGQ